MSAIQWKTTRDKYEFASAVWQGYLLSFIYEIFVSFFLSQFEFGLYVIKHDSWRKEIDPLPFIFFSLLLLAPFLGLYFNKKYKKLGLAGITFVSIELIILYTTVGEGGETLLIQKFLVGLIPFYYLLRAPSLKNRLKRERLESVYALVMNSGIRELSKIEELCEIPVEDIRTILGELLTQNRLSGRIEGDAFVSPPSQFSQTDQFSQSPQFSQADQSRPQFQKMLSNLEEKYKNGEIDEMTYYKLKSEYQERMIN